MRKLPLLVLLALSLACAAGSAAPAEVMQWRSGLTEINEGWAAHDGDNMAWASAGFDDSNWKTVDLEDMGIAQPGWRWFRKHVNVGPDYPEVKLLLDGGEGTYELYVNGQRVQGAGILSPLAVNRPVERVFTLDQRRRRFRDCAADACDNRIHSIRLSAISQRNHGKADGD